MDEFVTQAEERRDRQQQDERRDRQQQGGSRDWRQTTDFAHVTAIDQSCGEVDTLLGYRTFSSQADIESEDPVVVRPQQTDLY